MEAPALRPYREGLRNWLRTATKRLCVEAKARICQEVGAHYTEAVDVHREEGMAEADAHSRALSSLGPPRKAAREFRKTHLTHRQAVRLEKTLHTASVTPQKIYVHEYTCKVMFCFLGVIAMLLLALVVTNPFQIVRDSADDFWESGSLEVLAFLIMLAPLFVLLGGQIAVQRRRRTNPASRRVRVLSANDVVLAHTVHCGYIMWLYLCFSTHFLWLITLEIGGLFFFFVLPVSLVVMAAAASYMFLTALLHLSLWQKLRRGAEFTDPRGRLG